MEVSISHASHKTGGRLQVNLSSSEQVFTLKGSNFKEKLQ